MKSYPTKKLGEVLALCDSGTWGNESPNGMSLLRSTNMQNGELMLDDVKYIDVAKDKINRYTLREGDILITKSSGSVDHIGKSLFITKDMDGKYGFSNFTQRLRVNQKIVLPKWVYLKISNPATRDFLLGVSQTTTGLRNLKIPALKELEIPLPPIGEQKKIVAKLEGLLGKIKEAKRLRAEAQSAAGGLLPAELHKTFSEGKKKGWEEKELGGLCGILDNLRKPVTKRDRKSGPYPYYGATGVQDYVADFIFDEDLVLVGEDGAKWGTGDNSAYKISGKSWVNNHAHVLRPNRDVLIDGWLVYVLNMRDLSEYITGTTVKKLNQAKLRSIKIPLPSVAEQKKIVAHLDLLSEKIKNFQQSQAETAEDLKSLEQSILHQAFAS